MLRRTFALAALAVAGSPLRAQTAPPSPAPAPLTVVVVRHAERPEGQDPSLNEAGRRRATELIRVLRDFAPSALFVTEFKRTAETLAPLAAATGVAARVLPARDLDGLATAIQALSPGSHAVVASHSNLVHLIVERLSGVKVPELTDSDYDRLVVVTVTGPGRGAAVVLRYGEPSAR
jgi:broad specificity phosphatase PhoE